MLLYPPPEGEDSSSRPSPNFYRPFQLLDSRFEARLKELVEEPVATEQLNGGCYSSVIGTRTDFYRASIIGVSVDKGVVL